MPASVAASQGPRAARHLSSAQALPPELGTSSIRRAGQSLLGSPDRPIARGTPVAVEETECARACASRTPDVVASEWTRSVASVTSESNEAVQSPVSCVGRLKQSSVAEPVATTVGVVPDGGDPDPLNNPRLWAEIAKHPVAQLGVGPFFLRWVLALHDESEICICEAAMFGRRAAPYLRAYWNLWAHWNLWAYAVDSSTCPPGAEGGFYRAPCKTSWRYWCWL